MKKIISVFLAVLMIAGCMAISFSASAASITINITVKEPNAGETPNTDNITVTPTKYADMLNFFEYHEGDNMDGWAGWNNRPVVTTAFEAGKHYYAYFNFNEYSDFDGSSIASADFYVNGSKATVQNIAAERVTLYYAFGACKTAISQVTITGLKEPAIGQAPDTTGLQVVTNIPGVTVTTSARFKETDTGNTISEAFEEGKAYTFSVDISLENGGDYVFSKDLTATINGKTATKGPFVADAVTGLIQRGTLSISFAELKGSDQPEPQPENLCKWCGKVHEGFFQGIIGFFHRILAAIFGAKY